MYVTMRMTGEEMQTL